jgi:hypothetical protein
MSDAPRPVVVCAGCRHYLPPLPKSGAAASCGAAYVDRITGGLVTAPGLCWERRRDLLLCGPDGSWFEERPE